MAKNDGTLKPPLNLDNYLTIIYSIKTHFYDK